MTAIRSSFLLIIPALLWGGNVLSTDTSVLPDGSEIILKLDSPFSGAITETRLPNGVELTISTLKIPNATDLVFSSGQIKKGHIEPLNDKKSSAIIVRFEGDPKIKVTASQSADGFGLRLKGSTPAPALPPVASETNLTDPAKPLLSTDTNDSLPTAQTDFGWRYIVALIFMSVLIFILILVKKRFQGGFVTTGWLQPKKEASTTFDILFQKGIDPKTRVALFRLNGVKYLVLLGTTNILLDRFDDEIEVTTHDDFEAILRNNEEQLEAMLGHTPATGYERYRTKAENQIVDF